MASVAASQGSSFFFVVKQTFFELDATASSLKRRVSYFVGSAVFGNVRYRPEGAVITMVM